VTVLWFIKIKGRRQRMIKLLILVTLALICIELLLAVFLNMAIKRFDKIIHWLERIDTKLNDVRAELDKQSIMKGGEE
jgi:predicted PurR-regulated permease PerM